MKSLRMAIVTLLAFLALGTMDASAQTTMNVSTSINATITVTVTDHLDDFNGGVALTPAAANTYTDTGTFTLQTNTKVDVLINGGNCDLKKAATANNAASTLNVSLVYKRDAGTDSAAFGEGLTPSSMTDAGVAAGSYTYTITGTITDIVSSTTVRGSYTGTVVITATDLGV